MLFILLRAFEFETVPGRTVALQDGYVYLSRSPCALGAYPIWRQARGPPLREGREGEGLPDAPEGSEGPERCLTRFNLLCVSWS
jgi:hypothetical protein